MKQNSFTYEYKDYAHMMAHMEDELLQWWQTEQATSEDGDLQTCMRDALSLAIHGEGMDTFERLVASLDPARSPVCLIRAANVVNRFCIMYPESMIKAWKDNVLMQYVECLNLTERQSVEAIRAKLDESPFMYCLFQFRHLVFMNTPQG
jgi:hypothetical protein